MWHYNWGYSHTGTWWSASLDIATLDDGNTWDVTWGFTHIDGPHVNDDDPNIAGPFTGSFSSTTYGLVINDGGTDIHLPHGIDEADVWTFQFDRSSLAANTAIALNITHAPEPVSSTLFLVGAATLGFKRFRKIRKTA